MAIVIADTSQSAEFSDEATFAHDGSGTDTLLVVIVALRSDADSVTTCTYNGVGLTLALVGNGNNMANELWYKVAPTTGSNNVYVEVSGGNSDDDCHAYAATFENVLQASPLDQTAENTDSSGGGTVEIEPTTDNQLVIAGLSHEGGNSPVTGAGETAIFETDDGVWSSACSYDVQGSKEAQTMDWSDNSDDWAAVAASFKPVVAVAAIASQRLKIGHGR